MTEHAGEFEWRREGDEAEMVAFAPDEPQAERGLERALPLARLTGARTPVFAAASEDGFGGVVVSDSHVSPDLFSSPERGVLLVVEAAGAGGPSAVELAGLIVRDLSETRLPAPSEAWVLRLCESGAVAAAEDGLLEEEDLAYFSSVEGDPDSLGRAAVSGGVRGWRERPGTARAFVTVEILDRDAADGLGVERGSLVVALRSGAGDLGDVTCEAHRRRILARVDEFGVGREPVAAPLDSGEAQDLISAAGAAANFADARMALVVHAARRAMLEVVGEARISAAWRMGGLESSGEGGSFAHRMGLAAVADGRAFVSISPTGGEIGCGAGKMWSSVPSFGVAARTDGRDVWEEAGVLRRWARLAASEDRG